MGQRIVFGFYQSSGNRERVSVFGLRVVGSVDGECVGGLCQGLGGWDLVMVVCVVSLDYLCRWYVLVSVYCDRRITAHLNCNQCLILLHLINICFLPYIYIWQVSQIQTCLRVGPRLVSTSPTFMRSSASHPAGPHGRLSPKTVNRALNTGGGRCRHNLHSGLPYHCDSSIDCMVCR